MMPVRNQQARLGHSKGSLGTFAGVFTPSLLTILGIILFLRLGYVVGGAGLARALIIIGLANVISLLTSISLSAVATNLKVKGGGDYYLISRTLGAEFGGAIGIVLFLAQSVSIAFYCIGFGEALTATLPEGTHITPQVTAVAAAAFLFIFAWLGADWATRFQYVVMTLLALALISFFAGALSRWNTTMLAQNWSYPAGGLDFWLLFAIFFPAVTGFTQGVSMSGDLKDPGKSLPQGTFAAVGLSIFVYFGVAIVFAGVLPNENLINDYGAMKGVALFGVFIEAGVIGATLSSAMASFLGAPRILQSLASDRIFWFLTPFSHGVGPSNNPRRGVLLSAAIALATIGLGKLNLIAPVVSMFFLISYGLLNYATFYEARTLSPSFRPRFRWFDFRLSLMGFLACLGAMLAIDLPAGAVAIAVLFAIHQYLKRTAGPARWADSNRSYHLHHLREHLLAAEVEPEHPRDWRPQLLAFSDDAPRREQLLRFASWIEGGSGLTTVVRILVGTGTKMLKLREDALRELETDLAQNDLKAFPLIVVTPNFQVGIHTLIQAFGVGPLKANTILLNRLEGTPTGIFGIGEQHYGQNLRVAFRLGTNIIILYANEAAWRDLEALPAKDRCIDIWWSDDATSQLMLLLAYLMKRNKSWDEATIRLLADGGSYEDDRKAKSLQTMLDDVRIEAVPKVLKTMNALSAAEHSADAALVFLPFRLRGNQLVDPFGGLLADTISPLSVVAAVLAAEDIDLDAEPEDGSAGDMAAALDALEDAEKKTKALKKEAADAAEKADEKLQEVRDAVLSGTTRENILKMAADAKLAREEATRVARRAERAETRAERAARILDSLRTNPNDSVRKESHPEKSGPDEPPAAR